MSAKYPTISAGSASVSRSGGTVTVTVTFTATNGNSSGVYARYLRIRINGTDYTSGANVDSFTKTYTFTVSSYAAGSTTVSADLYYQSSTGGSFQYQETVSRSASWSAAQFTVYFNPGEGTTPTASKVVTYGSTYGTLPTPTRSGYAFKGWFTAGDVEVKATDTVSITANQTLFAKWEAMTIVRVVENGDVTTITKVYTVEGGAVSRVLGIYAVIDGEVTQTM